MNYYFAKTQVVSFDEAVRRAIEGLKKEGFGIITTIAHEALQLENKVGTMLPCNVVVQDMGAGRVEVAAIDPVASMQAIENPRLKLAAAQVQAKLKKVIENL
jgi:uncharacterized protein (DUF302 family)